jgi:hypothetical protein
VNRHLVCLSFFIFFSIHLHAAEILVNSSSLEFSGFSAIASDKSIIYGGIAGGNAGTDPVVGSNTSTVDTCAANLTAARACNQVSVHSTLIFKVSFKVTKDVNNAVTKMFIDNGSGGSVEIDNQNETATANNQIITLETTWGDICANSGLLSDCTGTTTAATKTIKVGVDSDNSGDVEDAEKKSVTLKLHYIAASDSVTQTLCSDATSGTGMCNLAFTPGDQKAYIDSAIYSGDDPTAGTIDWESIAIFPIPTGIGSEAAAFTGFYPGRVSPVFKSFDPADGTIPDSSVTGGMENYQQYCLVYGTKNQAQNIYRYVTDATAAATACIIPSEVVGILEDKSCFISTAAFGSDMAPEVKTFRSFRNQFLLTNTFGKKFVKTYYKLSPSLANIIAESEGLRMMARATLYPFLFYASIALNYGLLAATLAFSFLMFICGLILRIIKVKRSLVIVMILMLTPLAKADLNSDSETIMHQNAKEGLVRITADGTYIYDTKRELKSESSKLTFGVANQPVIDIVIETQTSGPQVYNFDDLYTESSNLIIGYDYEKFMWIENGKLGYQLGASAMIANGRGILVSSGDLSAESFTFLTLPINAGAVYRFEYKDKQWFAPYAAGGGTLLTLIEKRDDVATPKVAAGFGFYGAGGILLNVTALDPDAGFQLDNEYGISNLWLSLEFRITEVNSEAFSFSNQYVNAGLSFDF